MATEDIGTYQILYYYSLTGYSDVAVSPQGVALEFTVIDRCSSVNGLTLTTTPVTVPPEYTYDGTELQIDFSGHFISNEPTYCPVTFIACTTSLTASNECTYTGADTSLDFNSATGIMTFQSSDYSDAVFRSGVHTFTVTAVAGTNNGLRKALDVQVTLRCFLEKSDVIWNVPEQT